MRHVLGDELQMQIPVGWASLVPWTSGVGRLCSVVSRRTIDFTEWHKCFTRTTPVRLVLCGDQVPAQVQVGSASLDQQTSEVRRLCSIAAPSPQASPYGLDVWRRQGDRLPVRPVPSAVIQQEVSLDHPSVVRSASELWCFRFVLRMARNVRTAVVVCAANYSTNVPASIVAHVS